MMTSGSGEGPETLGILLNSLLVHQQDQQPAHLQVILYD